MSSSATSSESFLDRLKRVAGFIPAVLLCLVAWIVSPAWLSWATVLSLPLYLIAAAGWMLPASRPPFWARLKEYFSGSAWHFLGVCAFFGVLLAWPINSLMMGGSLLSVLAGAGVIGLALVWAWQHAYWPAFRLLPPSQLTDVLNVPRLNGAPQSWRAWGVATNLVMLVLFANVLGWRHLWSSQDGYQIALLVFAFVLAPFLSWFAVWLSYRDVQQACDEPLNEVDVATTSTSIAHRYSTGTSLDAALYSAARAGRVDEALALLDMGANPHARPLPDHRDQRTLPMLAAVLSDLRLLRRLIAAGVDLNLKYAGLTPLLVTVRDSYHGRPDAVLMLLTNGADPRPADNEGQTALHAAARAEDPAIAALLLDAGAPLEALDAHGVSPLGVAASMGNLDVAKYLIDRRAVLEPKGGEPALLMAASRDDDDVSMLKLMLRHKAKLDALGKLGRTALHAACLRGNTKITRHLIDAGAHPDIPDVHDVTPLMEAARAGAAECVHALTLARVNANHRDNFGRNALVIACQSATSNLETVKALLAAKVDPHQAADDGRRAIDHAVAAGRWVHVALLDPGYVLPACLRENDDELQDAPPLVRLRLALDREAFSTARSLLPLAITSREELATFYLDLAPRLGRGAANVLASGLYGNVLDTDGVPLIWSALALGPAAAPALNALLDRGAMPVGRGSLARYLNAALLGSESKPGGEDIALKLLERGADAFGADIDGTPPLQQALQLKWARLVAELLARGVDPDARDRYGVVPLIVACQLNDEAAVRRLVTYGAQPNARTPDGQTALGLALSLGQTHLARWMDWSLWRLPRRALRDSDVVSAAHRGDMEAVERLLELGLAINAVDAQGCTALLRACGGGHVELVKKLLVRGADAHIAAKSGATCLSVALTARQTEVVWALVQSGVRVDQRLPGGITPLMIAAALGQDQAVTALLNYGADVGATDTHGGTVLHALAQYGFGAKDSKSAVAAWKGLLAAGADINAVNAVDETPLLLLLGASFEAGTACTEEVISHQLELMLTHNVELAVRERRGFSPLHLAALHGLGRVVRRLLYAGANPDMRDTLNRRPAEIAVMRGYIDIAQEFAPKKVEPSIARYLRESQDKKDEA